MPVSAWVAGPGGGTAWFQPLMMPLSVAKMNAAGPELVPSLITNPLPPLKTMPVGVPGTVTTSGRTAPGPYVRAGREPVLPTTRHRAGSSTDIGAGQGERSPCSRREHAVSTTDADAAATQR